MECNILTKLSAFDVNAPINISISFDDSDESVEVPIKSENATDDYNNTIKVEVKEEPINMLETTEEVKSDNQQEPNITQDRTSLMTEYSQQTTIPDRNELDQLRKRKTTQLIIYKNKLKKSNQITSEPNNQASLNDNENICENSQNVTGSFHMSNKYNATPNAKNCNVNQVQNDKLSSYIRRCLLPVSEHMRLIIEAYLYHKHYKTSKDAFNNLKEQLFNRCYSSVVAMLLPEERNVDFIKTFLKETHRQACDTASVFKGSLIDYETLLRELLMWTKKKSNIDKPNPRDTVLKSHPENDNKNTNTNNKTLEQNHLNNVTEIARQAEQDNICIFSAGAPGYKISINVNPALQHLHNGNSTINIDNHQSPNSEKMREPQPIPSYTHAAFNTINTMNTIHNKQPSNTQNVNEIPKTNKTQTESLLIKYLNKSPLQFINSAQDIPKQSTRMEQTNALQSTNVSHLNFLSKQDQIQQLPNTQTTQIPSRYTPHQYGHSTQALQQCQQPTHSAPQQYGSTYRSLQPHTQYRQSHLGQQQNNQSNHTQSLEIWQYQQLSQYGHQQGYQDPPPYDQIHRQRQLMQRQKRLQPYLPSQNALPQTSSQYRTSNYTSAQHVQVQPSQAQYGQSQSVQSRSSLPQYSQMQSGNIQTANPVSTDWQQLNMLQHQTQAPTLDGALRTTSTDSGFISPLNFMSSEQTVPLDLQPQTYGTETANLLITHVTSLNPKVSFIEEDKCVVCKKTTKQVCMGCMKRYYCCYECQLVDWSNHEPSCKKVTT